MARPPRLQLTVSEADMTRLRQLRRRHADRALAFRSRIVLECAGGLSNAAVAERLKTSTFTVGLWRNRFINGGVGALGDEPRPGAPRKVGDEQVDKVVRTTLESVPRGATHWSSRRLAEHLGLTQSTVSRIWRAFGLKPHRTESFQFSADPLFVEKVRDVVGLYMSPPTNALVLCVDEKSQIQALNRTQPLLPMRPGQPERHTPEYQRHGTTSLFAALDIATGNVIGKCFRRHRSVEFLRFLKHIDCSVAAELQVHVVLDNYATHKTPLIKRWLLRNERFHLHFTPTHASWLNQVERWFGLLSDRQIKRGSHFSVRQLEQAIHAFIESHNDSSKPFFCTKDADAIIEKVGRLAKKTLRDHTPEIIAETSDSGD